VICIFGSVGVWIVDRPSGTVWAWRIGLAMGVIATAFLWYRADNTKEKLPDLLAQTIRSFSYFEREGLCFAPVVQVQLKEGTCWIAMFFQNRYAGPCSCRVEMLPPLRPLWVGRYNLPPINAELHCPGGAFGVCRFPYAFPARYQGRKWRFDVYASTKYPQGRGEMLRFRAGIFAGSRDFFTLTSARGHCRIYLPSGVTNDIATATEPTTQILWQPDLPTNAFPVIPTAEIAAKRDAGFLVNPEES